MRLAGLLLVLVALGGACGAEVEPEAASSTGRPPTSEVAISAASSDEPLSSSAAGPPRLDIEGLPMLGGAGPWHVDRVVSGDRLEARQGDVPVRWALAQVAAPRPGECLANEARAWTADYVARFGVNLIIGPGSSGTGPDGEASVEVVVSAPDVVADRGSFNVAIVRAGLARVVPPASDVPPDAADRVADLGVRLRGAEEAARAEGRGIWAPACVAAGT